ncbi:putative glutathione transferase protein [Rosellinia necatrix]|uniref:Putative glutathione transferase protein n=1 Tax=Rosellinia necatrix TaxID=77044 RepID=A0A1W2TUV8_ROSNE|nr:putative glutathione transferase protein [Rosellinia necatrix]
MHFSSSEDPHHLHGHDGHHHSNRPPPPPHAFRTSTLSSHAGLDLSIDTDGSILQHHLHGLNALSNIPVGHPDFVHAHHSPQDGFEREQPPPSVPATHGHRHSSIPQSHPPRSNTHHTSPSPLPSHSRPPSQHQFGLLAPNIPISQPGCMAQVSAEEDICIFPAHSGPPSSVTMPEPPPEQRPHGQLVNRIVVDPPNLQAWREKLFNVDDTITLTNDEFETYFPHIDNVYSHRSTQKYKRKNFISHYWDCRMKGRPPGTPKSDDPAKKKRKRFARERDLCDVKIKITEHFPDATFSADGTINASPTAAFPSHQFLDRTVRSPNGQTTAKKFWTIQRVNGNGGNGKGDGIPGPHKHTLQKSDEIKKSTVQRFLSAQEKNARKGQKPLQQKRPSGNALVTAKKHSKEHPLKLYAASFCPFSQRVWIALEAKGMPYQYCETDPSKRPTQLLEANPRGLVPAIRQGDWASGESTVILEYLEDYDRGVPLLPTDPRLKANCRLWIDHINAKIVPSFFALMRTLDPQKQTEFIDRLQNDALELVQAADERGPYFLGGDLCLVDIHLAPFVIRMSRILCELRNWRPIPGTRWQQWSDALEQNPHIQATTSQDELYTETKDIFLRARPQYGEQPSC